MAALLIGRLAALCSADAVMICCYSVAALLLFCCCYCSACVLLMTRMTRMTTTATTTCVCFNPMYTTSSSLSHPVRQTDETQHQSTSRGRPRFFLQPLLLRGLSTGGFLLSVCCLCAAFTWVSMPDLTLLESFLNSAIVVRNPAKSVHSQSPLVVEHMSWISSRFSLDIVGKCL